MDVLIVTGLSGAGKSTALRALEDEGFYCSDNIPVPMLESLVATIAGRGSHGRLAVGIDARDTGHLDSLPMVVDALSSAGHRIETLFLEAPEAVLLRRFSETRRRHPLGVVPAAITREIVSMGVVRRAATVIIDTEVRTSRDLRGLIRERWGEDETLRVVLVSFGFKNGLPDEADVVFDARFLSNPFDRPELRGNTGLDAAVRDFVLDQPDATALLEHLDALLRFSLPQSLREGRTTLTVALGCTGGVHRSVVLVEALKSRLDGAAELTRLGVRVLVRHRDA